MKQKKLKKARRDLNEFSGEIWLASSLANVLRQVIEDCDNVQEIDKVGLSMVLENLLKDLKIKIGDIRCRLFGLGE